MIRPTSLTALSTLSALTVVSASLAALDVEQAQGGLVLNNDQAKDRYYGFSVGLANKQIDQGFARSEDAVLQTGGTVRFWGFGLSAKGAFAVGQDRGAIQLRNDDPTTYASRPIKPGEMVQLNIKADFVFQIDGVYEANTPFLQLIPHLEKVTYPNQSGNVLKDDQNWLGLDMWLATPLEGLEFGGGTDWNISDAAFRGAGGFREFFQLSSGLDLALWQIANFGDRSYREYFTGVEKRGWTVSQIGGKLTTPMPFREWWWYTKADWTYWLKSEDREYLKNNLGRDAGDLSFAVGVEWIAEIAN
jgi:hypothetical protein